MSLDSFCWVVAVTALISRVVTGSVGKAPDPVGNELGRPLPFDDRMPLGEAGMSPVGTIKDGRASDPVGREVGTVLVTAGIVGIVVRRRNGSSGEELAGAGDTLFEGPSELGGRIMTEALAWLHAHLLSLVLLTSNTTIPCRAANFPRACSPPFDTKRSFWAPVSQGSEPAFAAEIKAWSHADDSTERSF
ncbi:unnamed protein product [Zymoseptoria tritici ST99CH_1A5]|uniref:Uncharacterized protein n=1 Tax=Zymoseptoria tritici ST99CH_1A5 TaxID=1276529 RepID=A0A1Y6M0R6_ZYMTR|nr:unnamed protein product [Zymoseptoria tritici ST99CH_1A5]